MNKVILIGRLTRDPNVRQAQNEHETTVARFTLAVDRRYKTEGGQSADFPSVVAFGKTGEFVSKYFKQGMKVVIEGRIQTGDYTDNNGVKHYTTDVIAENVEFAESKRAGAEDSTPPSSGDFINVPDEITNDLPFK